MSITPGVMLYCFAGRNVPSFLLLAYFFGANTAARCGFLIFFFAAVLLSLAVGEREPKLPLRKAAFMFSFFVLYTHMLVYIVFWVVFFPPLLNLTYGTLLLVLGTYFLLSVQRYWKGVGVE